MSILKKIKDWLTGGSKKSKSTSTSASSGSTTKKKKRSDDSYSSGGKTVSYGGSNAGYEDPKVTAAKQARARQAKTVASLASIGQKNIKKLDKKLVSAANKYGAIADNKAKGVDRVLKKLGEKAKSAPPDPKVKAAKESRDRTTARLKEIQTKVEKNRAEYHKATGNKYNVSTGNKAHDALARQRIKSGDYQGDPNVEKYEVKHHPIAASAARGALSGVTFGGSEVLAQTSKNRKKSGVEEYYQKNKNKYAEVGGEIVGSLAGFGLTGEMSARGVKAAASKLAPKALEKGSATLTSKLAASSAIRKAAEKEAVRRFGVEGATKEVVAQIARRRASAVAAEIGKDAAINVTTGFASDLSHAALDSEDLGDFAKNMTLNAGLNVALGGATSLIPQLRVGRKVGKTEVLDDLVRNASREANNTVRPPEVVNIRDMTRPQNLDEAVEKAAVENVERNADEAARAVEPPRVTEEVSPPKLSEVEAKAPEAEATARNSERASAIEEKQNALSELEAKGEALNEQRKAMREEATDLDALHNSEEYKTLDKQIKENADEMKSLRSELRESRAEEARETLTDKVGRLAKGEAVEEADDTIRLNEDHAPMKGNTPSGVAEARSAYERNTGETVEGGMKTSWHEAWEASKEYHQSHATGNRSRLSKTSVSQLNAMDSEAERELREKLVANGDLDYRVVHTDELLDKVSKEFRDDPDRWVKDMIDANGGNKTIDFRDTPKWQAMTHYIMAVVDPSADPASEIAYTEAFKLATAMSSKAGQTNNLRRQFVHLTPAGKRDALMEELASILYSSKGFRKNHKGMPTAMYDAKAYIKAVLEDDPEIEKCVKDLVEAGNLSKKIEFKADDLDGLAKVSDDIPFEEAAEGGASGADKILEAHAKLLETLNKHNPKTAFDVVQEIRYLNMLGNLKTHIRNIFGSGFFGPIRQISNAIRAGIEDTVAKNAKMEITKHGGISLTAAKEAWAKNPTSVSGKKALEAFERRKPDILGSMKYDNQLYKGRSKTKAGKVLDAASDFNSKLLSGEDDFFREKAFRENYIKSYEKYLKSGVPITEKIERKIEAEAIKEAEIATFNEYNELANFLARITKKANDPNASTLARWGGRTVNAVMPFTKVPANIMKESVNYSPLGLAKGFSNIQNAIKKQDSELLNTAIDELSSGLTGTGIFALGMFLGKTTDMFTTNAGKNDAAAKFKKAQGIQNYSVTFSPPGSKEKYSVTLDWLVPNSATFFSGVELANQMKAGDFNLLDFGGDWAQVTSRLIEPVMETSMLSGLYSMLESTRSGYGDDDTKSALTIMLRETAQSYINSMIPTVAGQIARTAYKSDKQVSGDDDWEYFRNSLKSKTGLAADNKVTRKLGIESLGADTTAYGDVKGEKNSGADYAKSALKNLLSPANIQKVDLSELDEKKIKEYEDAVKNGEDPQKMAYLFPKKQYKKQFSTGKGDFKMDLEMSNKDLSTYNQAKTTGGAEGARVLLESIMFNRPVVGEDGKKVPGPDAYSAEEKAKIIKQFEGKSLREVEEWLYKQPQFKNADDEERRKAINHLWNLSGQGKAQGAQRVGEQAVVKAQGGDVDEYNALNELSEKKLTNIMPYIEASIISYADAVDFARNAGKTYYYENDEGGSSQTYYNKKQMLEYLEKKGLSEEQAAALFNSFKASNAKEYGSSSRRGYRRGYRRGFRRWHRRGGSSAKAKVPKPTVIKANQLVQGEALVSKKKSSSSKATPPTIKRVKAKVDLPTARK